MDLVKKNNDHQEVETTKGNYYNKPQCDVYESSEAYTMVFDLPGVEKNDIDVKVEKDLLVLTAECSKKAGDGYTCLRDEMIYNGFKRTFDLGKSVDNDGIAAQYTDGTLVLTLPKREEQKTKKISIAVN
jgi:HSP20 family protein